jgi:hypothetical protein
VRRAAAIACAASLLAGCAQVRLAVPGVIGDQTDAGEITGSVASAGSAAKPGKPVRLADEDWIVAQQAIRDAVDRRAKDSVPWINPETGTMGTVALKSDAPAARGCAGFDLTVLKGESAERLKGQACRGPHGDLKVDGLQAYSGS